jgi:putative ABC transport system substrate-binding protein
MGDGFFVSRSTQIAALTNRQRIPSSFTTRPMVEAGLLMGYSGDIIETLHQVGVYTGRILSGVKPADLPVLQATKFSLVLNLKTARALGIEVPSGVLSIADEVIE